jgi:hypothetical protein
VNPALLAFLLAAAALAAPAGELRTVYRRAYEDTRPAVLDVHLLLTSAQARLTRLGWDLAPLGEENRERAGAALERFNGKAAAYRPLAEAADLQNAPSAAAEASLKASGALPKPAVPDTAAAQADEILALRARYDAAESRAAGRRAAEALALIEARLGKSEPTAAQLSELAAGRALASELESSARGLLPGAPRKGEAPTAASARERARRGVEGLREDAKALRAELARLEIHHRLNALYARHPDAF